MQGVGYLAIWSDLTPHDETDWAHWITREHAAERVGVSGFLACRIFRALGVGVNRYFILYELEKLVPVRLLKFIAETIRPTVRKGVGRGVPKAVRFAVNHAAVLRQTHARAHSV